jgi:hypothetical protein
MFNFHFQKYQIACISNAELFIKSFHLAFEFDHQGLAFAVERFARRHFDPAFTGAVFLHIISLFAIEPDTDVVLKHSGHVKGAAWIDRQVIRQEGAL